MIIDHDMALDFLLENFPNVWTWSTSTFPYKMTITTSLSLSVIFRHFYCLISRISTLLLVNRIPYWVGILFLKKDRKSNKALTSVVYFNQCFVCAAPKCWSKYTTDINSELCFVLATNFVSRRAIENRIG